MAVLMDKQYILEYLKANKESIRSKYGVTQIGLYGSFVRDEQKDSSDIDIAIEMEAMKKNIHNFFSLKREFESVFGRRVDLGIESSLKPAVVINVKNEIEYVWSK